MLVPPPLPPKDYVLKEVRNSLRSSAQFTPNAAPRVTQSNIAKFCSPIPYGEDEIPERRPPIKLEPVIREKMTNDERASWVVAPGKDDFFVHEVCRKYTTVQKSSDYDPRYKPKERVFNRSYKYELDCAEAIRLEKLRQKCQREQKAFEGAFQELVYKQMVREKPTLKVAPCKEEPPFWWKAGKKKAEPELEVPQPMMEETEESKPVDETCIGRWVEEPNLAGIVTDDPCKRKYDMQLVGQSFRTEACNWYYKNYPSPDIIFRPKRFV